MFHLKRSKRIRRLSFLEKIVRRYLRDIYAKDLLLQLEIEAMRESVDYIRRHMDASLIFTSWHALHRHAIEQAKLNGLFLEFGVKKGETLREIAKMTHNTVHGFDSFQGLPED